MGYLCRILTSDLYEVFEFRSLKFKVGIWRSRKAK